jgi:hypothetical protein
MKNIRQKAMFCQNHFFEFIKFVKENQNDVHWLKTKDSTGIEAVR